MLGRHFILLLGLFLAISPHSIAVACRYSVRDTGFIDLGTSAYRLELVADPAFPNALRQTFQQAAAALLLDSNIAFDPNGPAPAPGQGPGLRLVDSSKRTLDIARLNPTAPADALRLLESVASSPARDRLFRETLRAYAVVLLIEGSDSAANHDARASAQAAIEAITRLLPTMAKPMDVPPVLLSLSPAEQAAESVLLWGLGFDTAPTDSPRMALVFGRGRRLGSTLEGPLITQTALRERLVLIGQDCECELDRAWLSGPLLPGRWDRTLQQTAARTLGFDPENPVVRAEVSRIIERGPQANQRKRTPATSQALGYSEESIEEPVVDPSDSTPPTDPTNPSEGVATPAPPASPGVPPPASSAPAEASGVRRAWIVLAGAITAALAAGTWLFFRSSSR